MDEHRDMEDFEWNDLQAGIEQAQAAARDVAPIMATAFRALKDQGLDTVEASFAAAAWMWTAEIDKPGKGE